MKLFNAYAIAPTYVQQFIDATIKHEAGYVNDPSDSGGETNFGITYNVAQKYKRHFQAYAWDGDMQSMPRQFAQDVYSYQYFFKCGFDVIAELSPMIAQEMFDTGVNCGTKRPRVWLQELLNVFNNREQYYNDIEEDGIIGTGTYNALKAYLSKRKEKTLYNALNIKQGAFYLDLASNREKDEKFVTGWIEQRVDFKK